MSSMTQVVRDQNNNMLRQSGKMRSMLWILLILIVMVIMVVMSFISDDRNDPIPDSSKQMIIVRTPSWSASKGIMQRYERCDEDANWVPVDSQVYIILGRNGLGWGKGLHSIPNDSNPVKREGDGKSPAGVFRLGEAFGIPSVKEIGKLKIPYRSINEYLECIDDIESQYYNKLVENNAVTEMDWKSSERIQHSPNAYHFGLVVKHNKGDIKKGAGSCIFLHCVSLSGDSTAGCTTMSRDKMESLIRWLDADKEPVLVQLPGSEYYRLKDQWDLPDF